MQFLEVSLGKAKMLGFFLRVERMDRIRKNNIIGTAHVGKNVYIVLHWPG